MRTKFTLSFIFLSIFFSFAANAVTIGGALWEDKNRNGIVEKGEEVPSKYIYVNAIKDGIVVASKGTEYSMGWGQGRYYIADLPANTSGFSLVMSLNPLPSGSSASLLNTAAPEGYMYTFDNIGGNPATPISASSTPYVVSAGTALSSTNNISNITTGTTQMNNYNFGLLKFPVAFVLNYNLPTQPSSDQVFSFTGAGELPVVGNGTTVSSFIVTQLPTNGAELYYDNSNGLRLNSDRDKSGARTLADPQLVVLNEEIQDFDAKKLTLKLVGAGYRSTSFRYTFKRPSGQTDPDAPYTISWESSLPVTLTGFAVKKEGQSSVLSWRTVSESNSKVFELEHKSRLNNWQQIGSVGAKGESSSFVEYSFIHTRPAQGENLYRLKMIDQDGSFAYSRIISLNFESDAVLTLYPNPTSKTIRINENVANIKSIHIYRTDGTLALAARASSEVDVDSLPGGIYLVRITTKDGGTSVKKVVINR